MASRTDNLEKRVHFDSREEKPTQRELLDRKAAEDRMKEIGGYGNGVIQRSNPDRAPIGTGGSDSVYQTKRRPARSITPPVELPSSSTPKTLPKSGSTLGPPLRVLVNKAKENEKRVPGRARVGEKK